MIASIDGNKNNRDSSLISGESSGAYFGSIGALRSLAQLAGLSSIFVNLISLSFAALLSAAVKIRERALPAIQTRVGRGPTMYELMKFKNPSMLDLMKFARDEDKTVLTPRMKMMGSMTGVEIQSDLMKWLAISLLLPLSGSMVSLEDAVAIGVVSGVASQLVREQKDRELSQEIRRETRKKKKLLNQFILSEREAQSSFPWTPFFSRRTTTGSINKEYTSLRRNKTQKLLETFNLFLMQRPMRTMRRWRERTSSIGTDYNNSNSGSTDTISSSSSSRSAREEVADLVAEVDFAVTRFARAAVEGAAQLVTYEAARRYVMEVSPYFQQLNSFSEVPLLETLLSTPT